MATIQDRLSRLSPEQRALIAARLSKRGTQTQDEPQSLPPAKLDPGNRFLNTLRAWSWRGS